ncbi:MAG: YdcF family protein [Rhizomicrobium sp.]
MASAAPSSSHNVMWKIAAVIVGVYLAGFLMFVLSLPRTPSGAVHADGIVALTGGDSRLGTAEALLEQGAGKRLLISGVYSANTKSELKRLIHGGRRFDCCADLGFRAMSTHGNAAEAAAWTRAHGYRSLVIVTANFHMPRSLREFAAQMPGVRLLPYPVEEEGVDVGEWWSDPHALRVLHVEYMKYLGSLVFTTLARRAGTHGGQRREAQVRREHFDFVRL